MGDNAATSLGLLRHAAMDRPRVVC